MGSSVGPLRDLPDAKSAVRLEVLWTPSLNRRDGQPDVGDVHPKELYETTRRGEDESYSEPLRRSKNT